MPGLSAGSPDISMDRTDGFSMVLPDNVMFSSFDLSAGQGEDIKKAGSAED